MKMDQQLEAMLSRTLSWLKSTRFATTSLVPLPGGEVNFTFLAHLQDALEDGTDNVVVKHSEDFVRHVPEFKVSLLRVRIEFECLRNLASLELEAPEEDGCRSTTDSTHFIVRTPNGLLLDETAGMQVHEYMPHSVNLRTYALKRLTDTSAMSLKGPCSQLGKALGRWARAFHDRVMQQSVLVREVGKAKESQQVKQTVNYQFAVDRVQQFPSILTKAGPIIENVKTMAAQELSEASLCVVHGDFNPANILLPNAPLLRGAEIPVFVIDWEACHLGVSNLDVGQMIAEMYRLWLCQKIEAGLWMLQGFCEGYGSVSEAYAMRTAIHSGVHILSLGTIDKHITPELHEKMARIGRDIIVNGYKNNRAWFEACELACIFSQVQ